MSSLQSADMAVVGKLKDFIRHPMAVDIFRSVVTRVVATIVIAVLAILLTLAAILFTGLGGFLAFKVRISVWLLMVVAVLPLGALLIVKWVRIRRSARTPPAADHYPITPLPELPHPAKLADWTRYTKDVIHRVVWRWDWVGRDVGSLESFCPFDDTELVPSFTYDPLAGFDEQSTSFECETCGRQITEIAFHPDAVPAMIIRQIDRKRRTGDWKRVVNGGFEKDKAEVVANSR